MNSLATSPNIQAYATVLTPSGRGAVATIALHAELAELAELEQRAMQRGVPFFQAKNERRLCEQEINRILFGQWGEEELVVCRVAADKVEIYCHGGQAAIQRIMGDLQGAGVVGISAGELLSLNPLVVEKLENDFQAALLQSRTFRTAERIWQQRQIGFSFWLRLDAIFNDPLQVALTSEEQLQIRQALQWTEFGRHLTRAWNIVIAGPPNVGKSSLINALLGYERAIVYDQPGTTRDVVSGESALEGWPVVFSDTAGQRQTEHQIEAAGIELAVQALQQADLQVLLLDRSRPPDEMTEALLKRFPEALLVFNKIDLPQHTAWRDLQGESLQQAISCKTGQGLQDLLAKFVKTLIPHVPPSNVIYPVSAWQEQLLLYAAERL